MNKEKRVKVQIKETSKFYRPGVGYIFHGRDKHITTGVEMIEVAFGSVWDRFRYSQDDVIILTPGVIWEHIPECHNPNCYGQCCDIDMY